MASPNTQNAPTYEVIERSLGHFLSERRLQHAKCPKDGHCFLHAALQSFETTALGISLADLQTLITDEMLTNLGAYEGWLGTYWGRDGRVDVDVLIDALEDFLHHKNYNMDLVDVMPNVTANALKVDISVIQRAPPKKTHYPGRSETC